MIDKQKPFILIVSRVYLPIPIIISLISIHAIFDLLKSDNTGGSELQCLTVLTCKKFSKNNMNH